MSVRSGLKIAALLLVGGIVLAGIAVALLLASTDVQRYAGFLTEEIEQATGRKLQLRSLDLGMLPQLRLVAHDVSLANADWSAQPQMLKAKRIEAVLAWRPLLQRRLEIDRLHLVDAQLLLEADDEGRANWEFDRAQSEPPSSKRDRLLHVRSISVENTQLAWRGSGMQTPVEIALGQASLQRSATGAVAFEVDAESRGVSFSIKGSIGAPTADVRGVKIALTADDAELALQGDLTLSEGAPSFAGGIEGNAKQTRAIAQAVGLQRALPTPLALQAKVAAAKAEVALTSMTAKLGDTAVSGELKVKTHAPRPQVEATLRFATVELARIDTASAANAATPPAGRIFSNQPIAFDSVRALDGHFDLGFERLIVSDKLTLNAVSAQATLDNGLLVLKKMSGHWGEGQFTANGRVDVRKQPPQIAVALDAQSLAVDDITAAIGRKNRGDGGQLDVIAGLSGSGESLAQLMASANGEVLLRLGPMPLASGSIDWAGDWLTQLLDLVNPFRKEEKGSRLHCAVARLPVRNGVARADRTIAAETDQIDVVGAGTIDLRNEKLELALRPRIKSGLGIGAATLVDRVYVTGTLAQPQVGVDALATTSKTAVTVAGAIATGGLSLLGQSLLDKVSADPHPCRSALAAPAARK